jgi:hypothetical protein
MRRRRAASARAAYINTECSFFIQLTIVRFGDGAGMHHNRGFVLPEHRSYAFRISKIKRRIGKVRSFKRQAYRAFAGCKYMVPPVVQQARSQVPAYKTICSSNQHRLHRFIFSAPFLNRHGLLKKLVSCALLFYGNCQAKPFCTCCRIAVPGYFLLN